MEPERASQYASGRGVRAVFDRDAERGLAYVERYVRFVAAAAPVQRARILDAGCGGGWSTLGLRRLGHDAEGLDLHADALEASIVDPSLPYTCGDVGALPFPDEHFDVVAMHQVLEHVDDPPRALAECRRVLVPGGRLVVVGPNLESPALAARSALLGVVPALARGELHRTPEMPVHPYGNIPSEWVGAFVRTMRATLSRRGPRFELREADRRPPFHADNDASWFCNPADIRSWGRAAGMTELRWWSERPGARLWWRLAAGTWVVLER